MMMSRLYPLVVVALFGFGCGGNGGGSSSPTTPSTPPPAAANRAPTISSATVSPAFGIDSLTTFTFTTQASDPDGDALSYSWAIGSGTYTTQTVRLSLIGSGAGTARVTVTDSKGASSTATTNELTLGSMTGTWRLNPTLYPSWLWDFTLTQTGAGIGGTFIDNEYGNGTLDPAEPAFIDAQGNIVLRTKQGQFGDVYVRGQMDGTGRRIVGQLSGAALSINPQPFVMDKIGS